MKLTKKETKEMMSHLVDASTIPIHNGLRFALSEAIFDRINIKSKPKCKKVVRIKGSEILDWVKSL